MTALGAVTLQQAPDRVLDGVHSAWRNVAPPRPGDPGHSRAGAPNAAGIQAAGDIRGIWPIRMNP